MTKVVQDRPGYIRFEIRQVVHVPGEWEVCFAGEGDEGDWCPVFLWALCRVAMGGDEMVETVEQRIEPFIAIDSTGAGLTDLVEAAAESSGYLGFRRKVSM